MTATLGLTPLPKSSIPLRQNEPSVLVCQAAAQDWYSSAERRFYVLLVLMVVVPVAWASVNEVVAAFSIGPPPPWLLVSRSLAGLYALVTLLVIDPWLEVQQQEAKRCAAVAQEMFDTAVLDLPWSSLHVGERDSDATLHARALGVESQDPARFRDWYPPRAADLPDSIGRLACQRVNLWWDHKLRETYTSTLIVIPLLIIVLALAVEIFRGARLAEAVLLLTTLAPVLRWGVREWRSQRRSLACLDRLCRWSLAKLDELASGALHAEAGRSLSRALQDELFTHRVTAPIGFGWVYRGSRSRQERAMRHEMETLVERCGSRTAPRAT